MQIWTQAGIARLDQEIRDAHHRVRGATDARTHDVQSSSNSDSARQDRCSHDGVMAIAQRQLDAKVALRRTLQAAIHPVDMTKVSIGHQVTVLYLDDSTRKKACDIEVLILGGIGESDTETCTISRSGPFGRALNGQSVGAEVDIETDFGTFGVRIIAISLPSHQDTTSLAHAA